MTPFHAVMTFEHLHPMLPSVVAEGGFVDSRSAAEIIAAGADWRVQFPQRWWKPQQMIGVIDATFGSSSFGRLITFADMHDLSAFLNGAVTGQ